MGGVEAQAEHDPSELGRREVAELVHAEAEAVPAQVGLEVVLLDVAQVVLEDAAPAERRGFGKASGSEPSSGRDGEQGDSHGIRLPVISVSCL